MKYTPGSMIQELKAARKARDAQLESHEAMVQRYCQRDYKGFEATDFAPENHEYEYISLTVGKVCFANPRVRVRARRPSQGLQTSRALRHGLNQWAEEENIVEPFQEAARDFLMNFGVIYCKQDRMPGMYGDSPSMPHWPCVKRLSQKQFVLDPLCGIFRQARYAGHSEAVDKASLIEEIEAKVQGGIEEGWNIPLLQDVAASREFDWRQENDDVPDREELCITELWCPHSQHDQGDPAEGYHGTIYTLVEGQEDGDWVRTPRPAYVPRWGPYALCGAYGVPDSPWPLGPLTAVKGRVDELNAHSVAASKAMAEYKRLVICDGSNPKLAEMLKKPDMFVVTVKNFTKTEVVELEIGGLTPEHMQALAILRDRLDRTAGMSEARRGNAKAGTTATADSIAAEAGEVRLSFIQQRFEAGVVQTLRTAADYMIRDNRVAFPLPEEAAQELGMGEPWFHGGLTEDTAENYIIGIEPNSMRYTGSALERQQFMESLRLTVELAKIMPTMPHMHWRDVFSKISDVMNDDDWSQMVDYDIAAMMGGAPGALPGSPQPELESPKVSGPAQMGGVGGQMGMGAGMGAGVPAGQGQAVMKSGGAAGRQRGAVSAGAKTKKPGRAA